MTADKIHPQAKGVMEEMQNLLDNVYSNMEVSREKVKAVVERGRLLTQNLELWSGGEQEAQEFSQDLSLIEKKIYQSIDMQRLKEEGLVKTVKL